MYIDRQQIVEEMRLRKLVRKAIRIAESKRAAKQGEILAEEETWYFSSDKPSLNSLEPMYLVPTMDAAEMLGDYVFPFKIKPGAKWFNIGGDDKKILPYNIDTLGYLKHRWDDFTYRNIDIVWDIPDFNQGYEKIFVVNPDVLERLDSELDEISSMAGGSVAGYSMPLGAKRRRGKKKKVYMEPHMHQD